MLFYRESPENIIINCSQSDIKYTINLSYWYTLQWDLIFTIFYIVLIFYMHNLRCIDNRRKWHPFIIRIVRVDCFDIYYYTGRFRGIAINYLNLFDIFYNIGLILE